MYTEVGPPHATQVQVTSSGSVPVCTLPVTSPIPTRGTRSQEPSAPPLNDTAASGTALPGACDRSPPAEARLGVAAAPEAPGLTPLDSPKAAHGAAPPGTPAPPTPSGDPDPAAPLARRPSIALASDDPPAAGGAAPEPPFVHHPSGTLQDLHEGLDAGGGGFLTSLTGPASVKQ